MRTPVVTGELRAGATVAFKQENSAPGKIAEYIVTFVGTYPDQKNGKPGMRKKDVAGWLEFGTSKCAAAPFVRPAYEAKKAEALAKVREVILEEINKA